MLAGCEPKAKWSQKEITQLSYFISAYWIFSFFLSEANGSDVGEWLWSLCPLIVKVTFHITFQTDTMNLCNILSEKRLDSSIRFKGKWGFTWRIFHYIFDCFFFPCTNIKAPSTPNPNITFSPRCLSAYKDLSISLASVPVCKYKNWVQKQQVPSSWGRFIDSIIQKEIWAG